MTYYEKLRNVVLNIRRTQLRQKVAAAVDKIGSTDVELLRACTGIARPALLRALSELGYDDIPLDADEKS